MPLFKEINKTWLRSATYLHINIRGWNFHCRGYRRRYPKGWGEGGVSFGKPRLKSSYSSSSSPVFLWGHAACICWTILSFYLLIVWTLLFHFIRVYFFVYPTPRSTLPPPHNYYVGWYKQNAGSCCDLNFAV